MLALISQYRDKGVFWVMGLVVVALQAVDAVSTHLALETGKAQENNFLLMALAEASGTTVINAVVASKILVACLFIIAMRKTKPSQLALVALSFVAVYYLIIVTQNITLAIDLSSS